MKNLLLFLSLLLILLLNVSIVFSQSREKTDILEQYMGEHDYNHEKEIYSEIFLENRKANKLAKKRQFVSFDSTSVIDSLTLSKANGGRQTYFYKYYSNGSVSSLVRTGRDISTGIDWRFTYIYDSNENRTLYLSEDWNGSEWMKNFRETSSYNSKGNITLELNEVWFENEVTNDWRKIFTYDSNENLTSKIREEWDGSQWINDYHYTYTYDSNGNMSFHLWQHWNGSEWVNTSRSTYTYDSNDNLILEFGEYYYTTQWEDDRRTTYTYNSNQQMTLFLYENWHRNKNIWDTIYHDTYTYDLSGKMATYIIWITSEIGTHITYTYNSMGYLILEYVEHINGGDAENLYQRVYTYDESGNNIKVFAHRWNETQWDDARYISYIYDFDGNMIYAFGEKWDEGQWIKEDNYISFYDSFGRYYSNYVSEIEVHYSTLTDVTNDNLIALDFSLSQNYPNPFNPSTVIKYTIPEQTTQRTFSTQVVLKVYDILGREVATLVNQEQKPGNYEVKFDGKNLSSGIYYYRIIAGVFTETMKMMLVK